MDKKNFDRLIREKLHGDGLPSVKGGWEALSQKLDEQEKKRKIFFLPFWRIAAAVALLTGLGIGIAQLFNTDGTKVESIATANTHSEIKRELPITGNPEIAQNDPSAISEPSAIQQPQDVSKRASGANLAPSSVLKSGEQIIATVPLFEESEYATETHLQSSQNNSVVNQTIPSGGFAANQNYRPNTSANSFLIPEESKTRRPNTSLSLGGGMNYGVLNGGYNMAVSMKQNLSKKVFVEGAVSFLYNNQASDVVGYRGTLFNQAKPSSNDPAANVNVKALSDFYYLQVNPSVGYQIADFVSVSAGADLQQRVAGVPENSTAIYAANTDPKIVPKMDVGITAKTDFAISPQIEAGIMFRNGINNLIQGPDVYPYLNRRYLQVQLKYNFQLH